MRRTHAVAGVLGSVVGSVLLLTVGTTAAVADVGMQATFSIQFPKGHSASNAPCPGDTFCGVGSVSRFGPATITIDDETFNEIDASPCLAITRAEHIELLDGSGTLALDGVGTFCRPGGAGDSHASSNSYGSPGQWTLTYVVDGARSTGVFANAEGLGTEDMVTSGGIGVWHLAGQLRLA